MKVRAVLDFEAMVGDRKWWVREGDEFELPEGKEGWLSEHLVVAMGPRIERGVMGIGEVADAPPSKAKERLPRSQSKKRSAPSQ